VDEDASDLQDDSVNFRQHGYDVRACGSYPEALRCLETDIFDFIIVSQGGRDFEGRCILERAVEIDRYMPIVILTRILNTECYLQAMHLGALDYFQKPIPAADLLRLVKRHLRFREAAQA
jgi:DNA-binding NtrC family response regulator